MDQSPLRSVAVDEVAGHERCCLYRVPCRAAWLFRLFVWLACVSVAESARSDVTEPPTRAFPLLPERETQPSQAPASPPVVPNDPPPHRIQARWYPPARARGTGAEPVERDRWIDRSHLLEAHLGFGTPLGHFGIALQTDLEPYFSLVAGAGIGGSGPQVAAGVRARAPMGSVALGAELSWSGGSYNWKKCRALCVENEFDAKRWNFAHWINLSPALEFRSSGGFNARFYVGLGKVLNPGDGVCSVDDGCGSSDRLLFFTGIALGVAY